MLDDWSVFWAFPAFLLCLYVLSIISVRLQGPKAPLVGLKSIFEPRLVGNFRFFKNSAAVISEGYSKAMLTGSSKEAFRFVRNDADMVVLPVSMVDEIKALPIEKANPTVAHAHNLLGSYTKMDLILHSNLHFRMIQTRLTPMLGSLTGPMEDEVKFALNEQFPSSEEWTKMKPYHTILGLVARTSARVFVGLPLCRNEKWLEISTQFTEQIFVSVCFMRLFPTWTHPILSKLMPSIWKGHSYIRQSQKLLVPEILRRKELMATDKLDRGTHDTLLSWMIECADASESDPNHLAHLEIVISLAAIHTSQMNAVHVLYDLCAHPDCLEEIRQEIREVGGEVDWQKTSYAQLRKLDSFMKESQRFNPPSMLSYHRVMQWRHVLSDGTILPKGAHICMPVNAIQMDPEVTTDPEVFDGLRYYKQRQNPGEGHLHQFATTEKNLLNFGHGRYACPGRFFASLEIKVILVRLIMNYDFKFLDGRGRPPNLRAHEFLFPNPDGELLVRFRGSDAESPF
ncbi:MAG: hypothetical protein Q9172_005916 [Xanthocarpia lactea]